MAWVGLSMMLEEPFRRAVLPLFEQGVVEVLEHSFEIGWGRSAVPDWADALLDHYAQEDRLWGHGVTMSPFSAECPGRSTWLSRVGGECRRRRYCGVSEHYGFMVAGSFDAGAPLPLPPGLAAEAVGEQALRELKAVTKTPVGLENLALGLSPDDVRGQGARLRRVLEAVDGYLVLDLHNLYCQAVNFEMDAAALLDDYPLDRARCIHISGGSWSQARAGAEVRRFRRDTHDGDVPEPVFELLTQALPRCPRLEAVVLERLGFTIEGPEQEQRLREDFMRIRSLVPEAA